MFLHTLYQRLITGKVYVTSPDAALSRYTWSDMSNLVSEQVSALLSEMDRANERVCVHDISLECTIALVWSVVGGRWSVVGGWCPVIGGMC